METLAIQVMIVWRKQGCRVGPLKHETLDASGSGTAGVGLVLVARDLAAAIWSQHCRARSIVEPGSSSLTAMLLVKPAIAARVDIACASACRDSLSSTLSALASVYAAWEVSEHRPRRRKVVQSKPSTISVQPWGKDCSLNASLHPLAVVQQIHSP